MLLSYNISNIVRTLLNLHSEQRKPMTKSSVLAICKLIELLKCIQYTFHRQSMTVATYITHIVNHYELNLLMGLDLSSVSSIHITCVWVVCMTKLLVAKIVCFFSCCLLQRYIQESQQRGYSERALVRTRVMNYSCDNTYSCTLHCVPASSIMINNYSCTGYSGSSDTDEDSSQWSR